MRGHCFGVVLIQIGDQFTLRVVEGRARRVAVELALAYAVVGGKPVPEGNVQRGAGGVAKVVVAQDVVEPEL